MKRGTPPTAAWVTSSLLAAGALLVSRCSLDTRPGVTLRLAGRSTAPAMSCYLASVDAPDIVPTYPDGAFGKIQPRCLLFGQVTGLLTKDAIAAGATLRVSPGPNRTVRIFGFLAAGGNACPASGSIAELLAQSPAPRLYQLAHRSGPLYADARLVLGPDDYVDGTGDRVALCASGTTEPPPDNQTPPVVPTSAAGKLYAGVGVGDAKIVTFPIGTDGKLAPASRTPSAMGSRS